MNNNFKITYLEKISLNYWKKKSTILSTVQKIGALKHIEKTFYTLQNTNPVKIQKIEYV